MGRLNDGERRSDRKRGSRVPAWVRRSLFGAFVLALSVGNVWVVRRQFPPKERRRNEAYDKGLTALSVEHDYRAAELHFRTYLELDPTKSHVRYLLGLALQQQGRNDEAGAAYAAALEDSPNLDEARLALAELAKLEQDYKEARRQLDLAAAEEPTPANVFQYRGDLNVEIGDRAAAMSDYEEAIRRDSLAYRSHLALGDLLMSRAVLTGSPQDRAVAAAHFHDAENICRERLIPVVNEKEMRILMAKAISGEVRVKQQRSLSDAVKELERVRELDPDDHEPVLLLAQFLRRMGDYQEAERTITSALKQWPTPDVYLALHELKLEQKEPGAARKALEDAIAGNSEDAGLRIRLMGFLVGQGLFDDAAKEAGRAATLLGDDFRVHEAKGDLASEHARSLERSGSTDTAALDTLRAEALGEYRHALDQRPRSLRLKKKVAGELIASFLRRGDDAVPTEEEKAARKYLEDVLEVNRMDTEALAWKARFRLLDKEYEGVVTDLEPALDAADPSLDALRLLGAAAVHTGRDELAARAFDRVVARLTNRADDERRDDTLASAADWRNLVNAELGEGNNGKALDAARFGRRAWPADRELPRLLAVAAFRLGDAKQARDVLRAARHDFPGDVAVRGLYARALEETGDLPGAETELRSLLDEFPDKDSRSRYFAFLARTGRGDEAEQGFLALVASEPGDAQTLIALGDFYARQGPEKHGPALAQYEKALELTDVPAGPLARIVELHLTTAHRDAAALLAAESALERLRAVAQDDPLLLYLDGKLELARGRNDAAIAALTSYVERRDRDAAGHYYLARALRAAGRLEDAKARVLEAVALDPDRQAFRLEQATLEYELGVKAFREGRFDAAQALFASADNVSGSNPKARLLLAGAQANLGRLDVSEKVVRELLAESPDDPAAIHLLCGVLLQKHTREALDEAETLYRRGLARHPDDLVALIGVGTVQFQKGLYGEAKKTLSGAYAKLPGNAGVALAVAQCMALDNDGPGALEFIDGEIKLNPDSGLMFHVKGDFLAHFGQYDLAAKAYLEAFLRTPDNDVALLAAVACMAQSREYENARRLLADTIPRMKKTARLRVALADMLITLKRVDEAVEQLQAALAEEPDHPRALVLLGRIADQRGNAVDARRFFRESVRLRPWDVESRLFLAQLLIAKGDFRDAMDQYEQILRYEPRNTTALNNLAELLGRGDGELEKAIDYAKRAALLSEDPLILDTLGWLEFRAGKLDVAAKNLQRAALVLERNAKVQFHAGMAYARLKETADARRFLKRALAIDPAFEGAETAKSELAKLQ